MYVRPQQPTPWGFRKHTSQKITPLVRFYEKSAGHPIEPLEELCTPELLEPEESLDDLSIEMMDEMTEYSSEDEESQKEEVMTKSQTCPDLSTWPPTKPCTKERMTRVFSKGQMQLKRTTTWVSLPVQKLLSSPPVHNLGLLLSKKCQSAADSILRLQTNFHMPNLHIPNTKEDGIKVQVSESKLCVPESPLEIQAKEYTGQKTSALNKRIFVAPKRVMYCRVMQIINTASDRDCEYELFVYHNEIEQIVQRGSLLKVDKNMSADRPQEDAMQLEIQEPFTMTFQVLARYTSTRLRHGLAKMGILSMAQKSSSALSSAGRVVLTFDSKQDLTHHGLKRFKLARTNERRGLFNTFNIELVVDIKVEEELPAAVRKFPWAYTLTQSALLTSESLKNSAIIRDPEQVLSSQKHCQAGDYLTVYTRGSAHPAWKRYWVIMEENQLSLYDFTYKTTKGPVNTLSLLPLLSVGKPSMDDCENVGVARKVGIMLQFDRLKAVLNEDVRVEEGESLEGKAFAYCDDEANANHWRRALVAYTANEYKPKAGGGVDLRFLW